MSDYFEHDNMDEEQRDESSSERRYDSEEYRRPPYARENTDDRADSQSSYDYGSESGSSYSYDGNTRRKYSYDEPASSSGSDDVHRYSYEESESRYRARNNGSSGGNQPKGGHGKIIAAVVVAALAVGGLVGGASYAIGNYFNNHNISAAMIDSKTEEAQPETQIGVAEAPTEAAAAENQTTAQDAAVSGESVAAANTGTSENTAAEDAQIETAASGESVAATVKALDVTQVVDVAMPSVVAITTTQIYEDYSSGGYSPFYYYFYGYGGQGGSQGGQYTVTGAGSGIIIGDDGTELWIVTNNHVVEDAETLTVSFIDDTTAEAYVKGTDPNNDLAVVGIKLENLSDSTKQSIKAIQMGDSDTLKLGETVIAIGNALGLGQSVSTGVVSAVNREITTSEGTTLTTIQTDAAINPGNSGGALLDAAGQLIGINVAKDSETEVEGMGYAIPISSAKSIIEKLTSMSPREAVSEDQYPYMGVQLQDLDSTAIQYYNMPAGILVYSVGEDTPAAKAGMLNQDIITAFNGVSVTSYDQLTTQLQYYAGGTTVTVTVMRLENGTYVEHELTMTLGLRSEYDTSSQQNNTQQNGQQLPGNGGQQQIPGNGNGNQQQFPGNESGQEENNGSGWNGFNFGQ